MSDRPSDPTTAAAAETAAAADSDAAPPKRAGRREWIGLSVLGMIAAALGYLTPVQGALLQELIDVAVILNALRALRIMPGRTAAASGDRAIVGRGPQEQGSHR